MEDSISGYGIYIDKNGKKIEGFWENGKPCGMAIKL